MPVKRINKYFVAFQFLILTTAFKSHSQEYSFVQYDTRNGLAGSVVYDALQDHEGFMWFATDNGLSRFDGTNFKTFTTKDGLPDNEILRLYIDSKGRLWIMPFKAAICYYYKGKMYTKTNDSLVSKISLSSFAFDMTEDSTGNLFIAEATAWHEISENKSFKTINRLNNSVPAVFAIGVDKNGQCELLVEAYSSAMKKSWQFIVHAGNDTTVESIKKEPFWTDVSTSLINPEYVIIPRNHNSQLSVYKDLTEIISAAIPSNTVSVSYINRRKIIINTRSGIKLFDPETKEFSQLLFQDFSVTSAFEDNEKNLWLTTDGSGVLMIPSFQFRNYAFLSNKKIPEVSALCKKDDTVFAAGWTSDKIWKINITDLSFSVYNTSPPIDERIISMLPFQNGIFLTGTSYENPVTRKRPGLSLKSASMGRSGLLFAAHKQVLLCRSSGAEEIVWEGRSTSAVENDSGFFVGTLNGLFYKSYDGKIVDLGRNFPVFASRIVNLAISDKDVLWVTTKGSGVAAYSDNKLLYHFTETDGLTSDNCTSLYIDSNTVWVGTEKGLNRIEIDGSKHNITRFSMSDGLPSNNIEAIVAIGKKVFVGTSLGLTYFEVDKISQASSCDLQLTGIYIANKYWSYDSSDFTLAHDYNDVGFEFSGISFKSAGDIKYRYRMLGLQPDWRTTSEKQLSFPSLPSGKYTFQLEAINKYGVVSGMKQISFTVEKLLWEKAWFRILVLSLLVVGIWGLFKYRVHTIKSKEKEQAEINQRMAELEQKTLRSQMNPHFIFNSLNSIQHYVAERDITGANDFITDFSRLIRMTLDLSSRTSISMSEELEYITTYLKIEKARLENQFDYIVKADKALDLKEIYLPPLLLQPYIENCIRHGIKYKKKGEGLIKIVVEKTESAVLVGIEDNGVGREIAQKYKTKYHIQYQSRGTSISKDRIDLLNRYNDEKIKIETIDLYCEDQQPAGTRVNIYLTNPVLT